MNREALNVLRSMQHSTLLNYVVPGLSSSLIGGSDSSGKVRMFEASLEQDRHIVPHTHRYDFTCLVLEGSVINRVWKPSKREGAKTYMRSCMGFGRLGDASLIPDSDSGEIERWEYSAVKYADGQWYSMKAEECHDIIFSKDAKVLFFEGPQRIAVSYVLQPIVCGEVIPTFKIEPWMFKSDELDKENLE